MLHTTTHPPRAKSVHDGLGHSQDVRACAPRTPSSRAAILELLLGRPQLQDGARARFACDDALAAANGRRLWTADAPLCAQPLCANMCDGHDFAYGGEVPPSPPFPQRRLKAMQKSTGPPTLH